MINVAVKSKTQKNKGWDFIRFLFDRQDSKLRFFRNFENSKKHSDYLTHSDCDGAVKKKISMSVKV